AALDLFLEFVREPVEGNPAGDSGREREEARGVASAVDDGARVDERVRRDHLLPRTRPERGRPHLDVLDDTGMVVDRDFVAQSKRALQQHEETRDRKSTRLNSSHDQISYAVFCLKKKKENDRTNK